MNFKIGMSVKDAMVFFEDNEHVKKQDMGNGYCWLRGRADVCGEIISVELCFKNGELNMIDLHPHYNQPFKREAFAVYDSDYSVCQQWIIKHKNQLPESAKAYKDYKGGTVGVIIR